MNLAITISSAVFFGLSYVAFIYSTYNQSHQIDENALLLQFLTACLMLLYGIMQANVLLITISGWVWLCIIIILSIVYRRKQLEIRVNI
ncbi:MAG: hypothetical protein CL678_01850 [Bdellovibrionaceae bacterium]|nr:hypothetical protein [Pseudobdellovibrionaceae bacterium]